MAINYTVSQPGLIQGGSDNKALFYKKFSGEVLASFKEKNIMESRHWVKTITDGKSASFQYTGKVTAGYHVPGTDVLDPANGIIQTVANQEKIISIDEFLESAIFRGDLDEMMNHWDDRSRAVQEMSAALARDYDKKLLRVVALGADASAVLTGSFSGGNYEAGTVINGGATVAAGASFDAADLIQAIEDMAVAYDEKDVPVEGRYLALKPALYRALCKTDAVNTDLNPQGNGSLATGMTFRLHGFELLTTNNIPSGTINAVTGENNTYNGTFTNIQGLAWQANALATVQLAGIQTEVERHGNRNGWGLYARMALGHGYLVPAALGKLTSNADT